jgi:HlyD family secretion protein
MKKIVKWIILALIVIGGAGAWYVMATAPVAAETVAVSPTPASVTFTEQGIYDYDSSYTVFPIVSGEVLEVRVSKGDAVEAGDVLAVVDAIDYREQIDQLRASLAGYSGQIANLSLQDLQQRDSYDSQLVALQGQLATLREERAKNEKNSESLETQISIQESAVEYSRSAVRRARDDLEDARDTDQDSLISQARQSLTAAQGALAQSQLLLEQLKNGGVPGELYDAQEESLLNQMNVVIGQMDKSYTSGMRQFYDSQIASTNLTIAQLEERAGRAEILAAVSGVVKNLPIADQNMISPQQPAAVISSGAYVEVFVPVREIDSVSVGTAAELILDKRMGEEVTTGRVVKVDDEAEVKLSPLGVEERKVRVLISPTGGGLEIGYNVDARFTVWSREDALTAPKTAIFSDGGADCVWRVRDGLLEKAQIEKDVELRDAYVIASGLTDGDMIVVDANNAALAEGKSIAR